MVDEEGLSTIHTSPHHQNPALGRMSHAEYYDLHYAGLSGAQNEARSPERYIDGMRPLDEAVYVRPEPSLTLYVGGSLAKVSSGMPGVFTGATRGDVLGFSSAARRRLMRLIASIRRGERPAFVTLTYPDDIPDTKKAKRDIDAFGKRFLREYPEGCFIWRVEEVRRKSGVNAGEFAPHFHALVYGPALVPLRKFCSRAWYDVVGSGDVKHLNAGTSVDRVHSFGGIMRYVSKYIAKEDVGGGVWTGRVWGVIGRGNIPFAVEVVITLTDWEFGNLTRLARRMIGSKGKSFPFGLTWIANVERVLDYLESDCFTPLPEI